MASEREIEAAFDVVYDQISLKCDEMDGPSLKKVTIAALEAAERERATNIAAKPTGEPS